MNQELFTDIIIYLGTFAFAISGIRMAARRNFDLFGALVVGFVTAVGGGTVRDMLIGREIFWMDEPSYLICTAVALFFVIIFRKWLVYLGNTIFIFDTIGLGIFTMIGISSTLNAGYSMLVAIIMGTITGSAGGIMRDIFIQEIPLAFRKEIYAMASVIGGLVYYVCTLTALNDMIAQTLTIVTVILIRFVSTVNNLSLPTITQNMELESQTQWKKREPK